MEVRRSREPLERITLDPARLHVLVFGPSTGEAVIVVLPQQAGDAAPRLGVVDGVPGGVVGRWIAARLGGERLLFACLTHPHADHYKGFAELLRLHPPEHLWWSGDEEGRFFKAWAELLRTSAARAGTPPRAGSIEELRAVLDASLKERRTQTRHRTLADRKRLLSHGGVEIDGLLPTTSEKYDKLQQIVVAAESADRDGEVVNDLSGAITLRWGGTRVLLGGDCNAGEAETHRGWAGHGERLKPFTLVKVPHHGSDTAHHDDSVSTWGRPVGVLTPYQRGNEKQPPKPEHLEWWGARLSHLFMTTPKDHMRRRAAEPDAFARAEPRGAHNVVMATMSDGGEVDEIVLFGEAVAVGGR